jgi:AcrR family transcriptional regulator
MDVREKIIDAAMTAYAETGFQGATTRRVADIAGVNEVTIFRHFGSKAALMDEAIFRRIALLKVVDPPLPAAPVSPEQELSVWCESFLNQLHNSRGLLRKAMGAADERFHERMNAYEPTRCAERELHDYVRSLQRGGWIGAALLAAPDVDELLVAAQTMLVGALWGDAMAREMHDDPDIWVPRDRASHRYVQVFLRALGVSDAPHVAVVAMSPSSPTLSPSTT